MTRHLLTVLVLVGALAAPAFAADGPVVQGGNPPVSRAKARAQKKRAALEQSARSQAMVDAAIAAQGQQVVQAEANRQAAIVAEQQAARNRQAQQLNTIQQNSPRAVTVTRVGPDGTYQTYTYWVYPNTYPVIGSPNP